MSITVNRAIKSHLAGVNDNLAPGSFLAESLFMFLAEALFVFHAEALFRTEPHFIYQLREVYRITPVFFHLRA